MGNPMRPAPIQPIFCLFSAIATLLYPYAQSRRSPSTEETRLSSRQTHGPVRPHAEEHRSPSNLRPLDSPAAIPLEPSGRAQSPSSFETRATRLRLLRRATFQARSSG